MPATVAPSLLLVLVANSMAALVVLPMPSQTPAEGSARPFKLDIRPVRQPRGADGKVSVEVSLHTAANKAVSSGRLCEIEVEVTSPSRRTQKYAVSIRSGESSVQFSFYVRETGLFLLRARDTDNSLLPAGNSVFVAKTNAGTRASFPAADFMPAHFLDAVYVQGGTSSPAPAQVRRLLFVNSTGRELLADGKDYARLQVYFIDPDARGSPSDIQIWFSWSNGGLSPQPLVIRKGEASAEARLTSRSPVDATVSLVASAPAYPVDGQRAIKVTFDPPIYGIRLSIPNPSVLSLIDCQPLLAQFFDDQGRTVQTSRSRRISFSSSTPVLRLAPSFRDVKENETGGSVLVFPSWIGRSTLTISAPGYEPQTIVVEVTMWTVLVLCLCGGTLGGIAAKETLNASFWWRIFTGVIGAVVLVWFCVYAVLPQTPSMVGHSQISAFVVSVIGGYGGTRVLHLVMRKMGLPFAENPRAS